MMVVSHATTKSTRAESSEMRVGLEPRTAFGQVGFQPGLGSSASNPGMLIEPAGQRACASCRAQRIGE